MMAYPTISRYLQLTLCLVVSLTCFGARSPCSEFTLVSREQWKAEDAISEVNFNDAVDNVIIHDTGIATHACYSKSRCMNQIKELQKEDMKNLNYNDIRYNFLIGPDNRVYEGRGWDLVGEHISGDNSNTIGLAFIGSFTSTRLTDRARKAAKALLACGVQENKIKLNYSLHGHRDIRHIKNCPGDMLYGEIKTWDHYASDES